MADNQELTSYAFHQLLQQDERNMVYRCSDKAGLLQLLKEHEYSVVLLDYSLFDFADEEQLLIASERFAMTQWILVSDDLTKGFLRKMTYSSHAFSILFKDDPIAMVREAIQSATEGRRYVSQRAMEVILAQKEKQEEQDVLTFTEKEIIKAIAQGKTTKEIASERFSSVHTINTHRKNIFRKLGINTAHEAIKYALRAGWVDASEFYI